MNYLTATFSAAGLAFLLGGGSSAQSRPVVFVSSQYGVPITYRSDVIRTVPTYSIQQTRTLDPLPPLPPLTEFYNGQPNSVR